MIKWLKAQYQSRCFMCDAVINVGDSVLWSAKGKMAMCEKCGNKFIEWKGGTL